MQVKIFLKYVKIYFYLKKKQNFRKEKAKPSSACLKRLRTLSYLHGLKQESMNYGKKLERHIPRCLECGDKIRYGRPDKKFCSEDCKNRHHNHLTRSSRYVKRKILSVLEKNHELLDELVRAGVDAVWLSDIMMMGFNPYYVTYFRKMRGHWQCGCFDINYIQTANRLSSISKIQNLSLNLQAGPEKEDQV